MDKIIITLTKDELRTLAAKAGRLDHIWPVRLLTVYITKQQAFKSGFWWSI